MPRRLALVLAVLLVATPFLVSAQEPEDDDNTFYFFYSNSCSHCEEAHPLIRELSLRYPRIPFRSYEISANDENRSLFEKKSIKLSIGGRGVPTFILGSKYVVGFKSGMHDTKIREMIENRLARSQAGGEGDDCGDCGDGPIEVPGFGPIDPRKVSLPSFTFVVGLLDGLNPCAIWVLTFLLTLLVNAGSRRRILTIGALFVVTSALVYFLFMAAWLNVFAFFGFKPYVTIALGLVAMAMGLVNAKDFFFFGKGISLMIPESAKPRLFEKVRRIMNQGETPLALAGTVALAFFVNLVELGCTIGLPAVYARVLSIQAIASSRKYLYLALYNVCYVIPLAAIVLLFAATMGKYRLKESQAKVLKLVSGVLMLALGLVLVFKSELLVFVK